MLAALSMCGFPLPPGGGSHAIEKGTVEPVLETTPEASQKEADLVFDYLFPFPLVSLVHYSGRITSCCYYGDAFWEGAQCSVSGGRG